MKKYFYSDGKEKHGPLSFDELKKENIDNDTLIWFEGLNQWTPAKNIEEMTEILKLKPPIIKNDFNPQDVKKKVKTEVPKKGCIFSFIFPFIDYFTAFIVASIYILFDQPSLLKYPLAFFPIVIGVLVIPAIIALIISSFSKKKFSYVFAWTTVILAILAFIGNHYSD